MKILNVDQIRAWDAYTIQNEPVASIDLMERAANGIVEWIVANQVKPASFAIFCGRGNNGGDGLAIARLLLEKDHQVQVYVLAGEKGSADFETNLKRAEERSISIQLLNNEADFPKLADRVCVIDALFGTGLNRPLEGLAAALVEHINGQQKMIISVDMPSGLLADEPTPGNNVIKATYTLALQCPRLAFMMSESEQYTGKWEILDIGLSKSFQPESSFEWVLSESPWLQLHRLRKHAHKGMLGHVLISAGSPEKMGAAVMCAKACLRSGSGLLTMAVPEECFSIIQTTTPEAMCRPQDDSANEFFLQNARINSVALGPGWPTYEGYLSLLEEMIVKVKSPLLIDASGLFHLAHNPNMLALRPRGADTIITPHGGEFARLFGTFSNSFQRMKAAIEKARELNIFIVLKGAYTQVITPGGQSYFNSTGNPGMAKGGSGDVLTGIISSLLAQQYPATLACILAVYVHGLAGDYAAQKFTRHGMTAMDIVQCLPKAWKKLEEAEIGDE